VGAALGRARGPQDRPGLVVTPAAVDVREDDLARLLDRDLEARLKTGRSVALEILSHRGLES
jgi:hypothetical protein